MNKEGIIFDNARLSQEPIINVDATPDDNYPLRILKAYRENCNIFWSDSAYSDGKLHEPKSLLCQIMNENARQRAVILDKAIKILEEAK